MKVYIIKVNYENSAVKEKKTLLVFAEDSSQAVTLCEKKLVKTYDEWITVESITEGDMTKGFAFVID